VATPTGVLDGVAVYTWSGGQWTPPGGSPSPSTPSGALRGVAAFDWDGAVWQPAGQAGPDVATPFGVLQGVARFGWTGTAWAATGAPSLSLDFMTPGALDSRITVTRASTATYTDAGGTIRTAAANAPRWDYAGGTLNGLLIEEARTNLLAPSIPDAVGWGPGDATLTLNAGTAPDGANTMTRMVEAATTAIHLLSKNVAVTASVTNTFSVYAKAAQIRYLQIFMDNGANVGSWVTFDLQAGVISGPLTASGVAIGTASILPAGNGVWRCILSGQIGAATTARVLLMTSNVANPGVFPSYPGNTANGLLLWGAQLEQSTGASSYIPTTGATVTRAADVAAMPTAAWFSPAAGSLAVEFLTANMPTPGTHSGILQMNDGTGVNQVNLYLQLNSGNETFDVSIGSVSQMSVNGAFGATGTPQKVALAYGGGSWRYAYAGTVNSGAGSAVPFPATTINLGTINPPTQWKLNGYMRRLQYWPRALSNAEMQAVTT
jgi:hypothetical protein